MTVFSDSGKTSQSLVNLEKADGLASAVRQLFSFKKLNNANLRFKIENKREVKSEILVGVKKN